MVQAKHLFAGVAEGAMANVMEQSSSVEQPPVRLQLGCQRQHPLKCTACQMKDPQRVGESTGFSAVKGEVGRTQLADASQALERRRVHQVHHHSLGWGLAVKTNAAMQRVVIGPLAHASVSSAGCSSRASIHCSASESQRSPSPPGFRGSGSDNPRSGAMPSPWMSRPLGVT